MNNEGIESGSWYTSDIRLWLYLISSDPHAVMKLKPPRGEPSLM